MKPSQSCPTQRGEQGTTILEEKNHSLIPHQIRKETRRIDRFAIIDLVQEAKQKLGERGRLFSPTVNLKGFDLHGLDLTEIYIELGDWGARRIEFDFSNSNLQNTDLSHNTFYEPRFTGAILNGTKLIEARIYFADWEGSKIKDVDFSQSECMTIEINGRNLSGCRFYGTQISGIELIGCKLQNTVLDNCEIGAGSLVNSDLSNSSLVNSKLRDINLNYTNFNNTNMTGAYLGSVKAEGATFIDAVLSKSTITYSHLIIAKLRNAKLDQSDLSYCNLRGADLTNCDLSGANLSNTTLEGANLTGAVLRGAKNHSYARINNMTTFPDGTRKGIFNNLSKFI